MYHVSVFVLIQCNHDLFNTFLFVKRVFGLSCKKKKKKIHKPQIQSQIFLPCNIILQGATVDMQTHIPGRLLCDRNTVFLLFITPSAQ